MKSFVVLLFLAMVALSYQQDKFDSGYLPYRDSDGVENEEEDTSFYDPSCYNECSNERYQPLCTYMLTKGFRTFDNGCDYKNAIICEAKKLRPLHLGRCRDDLRGQLQ